MSNENFNPDYLYGKWLSSPEPGEEILISGMAGQLPESKNLAQFKNNLNNKVDMSSENTRRWNIVHPEVPDRTAKIFDLDKFDAGFFGVHHRQALNMDPAMRMLLESAIESVIDAGVNPAELEGTRTGVFISFAWSEIEILTLTKITEPNNFAISGYLKSFVAQRISYALKVKGPSLNIDAACSSSMNALHYAVQAMRFGQCENAIVATGNILAHPGSSLQFFRLGVTCKEGRCKVFDENANGFVRGEAIATLFLQKFKNARKCYAQINHIKTNCDGFKDNGITFPSSQMQQQLMSEIYQEAGIEPSQINYLETHGTGTPVGDPQEVAAIDNALAKHRTEPLLIGSVKSNIGHTEPASGICSIIKVLLAIQSGTISPNINLKKIKKELTGIVEGRMRVVTEATKIINNEEFITGINNFGFGGNNAHVILRKFKMNKENKCDQKMPVLICVSGRTKEAVSEILKAAGNDSTGLLHQIFSKNIKTHLYRGYTILNGPITPFSINFYDENKKPLYVFLGEFYNYRKVVNELQGFLPFEKTRARIKQLYKKQVDSKKCDFLQSLFIQIAIIDTLQDLGLEIIAVYTSEKRKILSQYFNGEISLEECVSLAYKITQYDSENEMLDLKKIADLSSLILNISDTPFTHKDLMLVDGFLDTLGCLYQNGLDMQLHKLYHEEIPIICPKSMISPSILWNHNKIWKTYKFQGNQVLGTESMKHTFSFLNAEHQYLKGHVIDGRNLFPATTYLTTVWQTFAQNRKLLPIDLPVVFRSCRFHNAMTIPPKGVSTLLVSIQKGTGYFEIVHNMSILVTGYISVYTPSNQNNNHFKIAHHDTLLTGQTEVLQHEEIYRELNLRGYNYSGFFKGIERCSSNGDYALIKWENNWSTFMDKMLQLKILQIDSRMLFVPIEIKKITLDPFQHSEFLKTFEKDSLLPVAAYPNTDVLKCGGIEISGLKAKSILKKKPKLLPVIEKNVFIPNQTTLPLTEAARVITQIILENALQNNFQAVEVVNEEINEEFVYLLPEISKALDDVPLATPNLTISTKNTIESSPGVKIEPATLTSDSRLLLIIEKYLLSRPTILKQYLLCLKHNGFLLSREKLEFKPDKNKIVEIIAEVRTNDEKLFLIQKKNEILNYKIFRISSDDFGWLPQLQNAIKAKENIIVYSNDKVENGILGLVNCLRREPNGKQIKCFFMMDEAPDFDCKHEFYVPQLRKNLAFNIYKNKQWGSYRHLLLDPMQKVSVCENYYLQQTSIGDLSGLKWVQDIPPKEMNLKSNESLILNYYSALNFKDVMIATGRVKAEGVLTHRYDEDALLGFEFAGKDMKGRRLMGLTSKKSFANYVVSDRNFSWQIPDSWSMEEAVTVPVVYSTVLYALFEVINMKPKSSILIHSATGGIGLAALNVCLYFNCDIYVTVGTQEKRNYLEKHYPQIPPSHIGNSRDTSFEQMIQNQTKNRGVDIVLNSLTDEKLEASIRCLARNGKFVEIGKYDMMNDSALNLLLLEKSVSYHGLMLDTLLAVETEQKRKILNLLSKGIACGYVKPLPSVVFPSNCIEEAYRHMTAGKHIGKILIKFRDEITNSKSNKLKILPRYYSKPTSSYIIIGGLGGIGLELTDWLLQRGAQNIILVSRTGIQNEYQAHRIRLWSSYGVKVKVSTEDVTTEEGCRNLIKDALTLGPLDGIFNLGVVLNDALFEDQTDESFHISLGPKARATKYMDQLSRQMCPELRYFVVFSSASCGRGNAGQSNYGMSNSVMERICEKRNKENLPALAIQWGAIGNVGLVAKMQKENKELIVVGTLLQNIQSCLEVLDKLLTQNEVIVSSMIVAKKHNRGSGVMTAIEAVADILGIKDLKTVGEHTTFAEMGMDSIIVTEIIQTLEKDFEIYVSPKEMRSLTFARLQEIENEKFAIDITSDKKIKGVNYLLTHIPESENANIPVLKLPTKTLYEKKIIIFPGLESVLQPFEPLINELKAQVYVMQYIFEEQKSTIQESATAVFKNLKSLFTKEDSFFFIGYSYGVNIALETASLFEEKGLEGKIIAIDGSPSYLRTVVQQHGSEDTPEWQTGYICQFISLFLPEKQVSEHKGEILKCKNMEQRVELGFSLFNQVSSGKKLDKTVGLGIYQRLKGIMSYTFGSTKLKSEIHLFKARLPMVDDEDENYHLSAFFEKKVQVTVIDGDHITILQQPELINSIASYFKKNGL